MNQSMCTPRAVRFPCRTHRVAQRLSESGCEISNTSPSCVFIFREASRGGPEVDMHVSRSAKVVILEVVLLQIGQGCAMLSSPESQVSLHFLAIAQQSGS